MAIVIREARESELDETGRILAAAFEQYLPAAADNATSVQRGMYERYLQEVQDVRSRLGGAILFVAVEADRIVGTATLYGPGQSVKYPTDVPYKAWPSGWSTLRLLAVHPAHRGRGIAGLLTEARLRRARDLGAPVVGLHTTRAFEVARRMYRQRAWERQPAYDYFPLPGVRAEAYKLSLG